MDQVNKNEIHVRVRNPCANSIVPYAVKHCKFTADFRFH